MHTKTIISKRQRLFQDGYLRDLSRYANQKPLACTFSVFELMTKLDPKQSLKIDLVKILRYVLVMSETCFKTISPTAREFTVILNRKSHTFRIVQTDGGPVITRDFVELT